MTRTVVHLLRHGEVHNPTGVLYGRLPGFGLSDGIPLLWLRRVTLRRDRKAKLAWVLEEAISEGGGSWFLLQGELQL